MDGEGWTVSAPIPDPVALDGVQAALDYLVGAKCLLTPKELSAAVSALLGVTQILLAEGLARCQPGHLN